VQEKERTKHRTVCCGWERKAKQRLRQPLDNREQRILADASKKRRLPVSRTGNDAKPGKTARTEKNSDV